MHLRTQEKGVVSAGRDKQPLGEGECTAVVESSSLAVAINPKR